MLAPGYRGIEWRVYAGPKLLKSGPIIDCSKRWLRSGWDEDEPVQRHEQASATFQAAESAPRPSPSPAQSASGVPPKSPAPTEQAMETPEIAEDSDAESEKSGFSIALGALESDSSCSEDRESEPEEWSDEEHFNVGSWYSD